MILLNGQWQGGADKITLEGLNEIKNLYLSQAMYEEVPIDDREMLRNEDGIIGLSAIKKQTEQAFQILYRKNPQKLFTIGGGCDADVASIAYMNQLYQGDLCVLWFDAHGDINSPDESDTHLFYGMPVRALLGDCGAAFEEAIPFPLESSQFIQIGGRAFDNSEINFMEQNHIPNIDNADTGSIIENIKKTGKCHCYIHLDLDVLNPELFPYVPVPECGGISFENLKETLNAIFKEIDVVGLGLYEYAPQGTVLPEMEWLINEVM